MKTVGELRQLLDGFNDDSPVLLSYQDHYDYTKTTDQIRIGITVKSGDPHIFITRSFEQES
jgi:hypothetical protein